MVYANGTEVKVSRPEGELRGIIRGSVGGIRGIYYKVELPNGTIISVTHEDIET